MARTIVLMPNDRFEPDRYAFQFEGRPTGGGMVRVAGDVTLANRSTGDEIIRQIISIAAAETGTDPHVKWDVHIKIAVG